MPNWCKNNLKIKDNGEKVLEILEVLKDEKGEFTMNKAVPMPIELEDTTSPNRADEQDRKELIEKYGFDNWYDWRLSNWGCKWDACESGFWKDGDYWVVSFSTPWGPPDEFMKKLSMQFPKVTFVLQFADEGMRSYPLGQATYIDGREYLDGPEEDTDDAEAFATDVWDEEWVELD